MTWAWGPSPRAACCRWACCPCCAAAALNVARATGRQRMAARRCRVCVCARLQCSPFSALQREPVQHMRGQAKAAARPCVRLDPGPEPLTADTTPPLCPSPQLGVCARRRSSACRPAPQTTRARCPSALPCRPRTATTRSTWPWPCTTSPPTASWRSAALALPAMPWAPGLPQALALLPCRVQLQRAALGLKPGHLLPCAGAARAPGAHARMHSVTHVRGASRPGPWPLGLLG